MIFSRVPRGTISRTALGATSGTLLFSPP